MIAAFLTPAEALEKGAAYIEEHGLWQGEFWPGVAEAAKEQGWLWFERECQRARGLSLPACALGSVHIVAESTQGAWGGVRSALERFLDANVPEWNDSPGRTAAEVADAMRACATNLRGAS